MKNDMKAAVSPMEMDVRIFPYRKEGRLYQPQQGPFRCSVPHPVRQWHLFQGVCHRERWNLYAVVFGCGHLFRN